MEPSVGIRDVNLNIVGLLGGQDLSKLTVVPTHNDVGSWSLELPMTVNGEPHEGALLLAEDGAGIVVTFSDGSVFSGPVESRVREQSGSELDGKWTFTGRSDMRVLADECAWPDPASLTAPSRANDTRTGTRETLIHDFVAANAGTREGLGLGADLGRGSTVTKSPRFTNLLELCQDIAGTEICFDVVQVGTELQLQTWVPVDHTIDVQLDWETGALSSLKLQTSAPAYTRAIVLGQDEGVLRQVTEVTTDQTAALEAVWGRRVLVKDQRQTDDVAEQVANAKEELLDESNSAQASSEAVPAEDLLLDGVRPGDWVTVVDGDTPRSVQLMTVPVSWSNGQIVAATVGAPIADEDVAVQLAQTVRAQRKRLDQLERSR